MSNYILKGILSSFLLFGVSSYLSFKYNELEKYSETIESARSQGKLRGLLYEIQKKSMELKALSPIPSLPKENYYRQVLFSYAEGLVLETGVGLFDHSRVYDPSISKVICVDWVKKCIEHGFIKNKETKREYLLEDCENLSFESDKFDTIVDIFGLQYYPDPEKVLLEMRRVCKKNGKILILAKGRSIYKTFNRYLDLMNGKYVCENGMFINRDWKEVIEKLGFEVIKFERKVNGTLYFYIIKNNK